MALPEGWEALLKGREALPEGREWSGVPPGGSRVVGKPYWRVGRNSRRVGRGWESLPEGREPLPNGWEWLGGLFGGPGLF